MREYSVLILAILLCISFYVPFPRMCEAAPVWSDNFDDGNYDGWTIGNGTFTAGDHTLRSIRGALIIHPNSVTTGTWSFDILGMNDTLVGFMSTYPVPLTATTGLFVYCYFTSTGRKQVVIGATIGADPRVSMTGGTWYYPPVRTTGWQHCDITRDSDGRICVYLNGTLVIDAVIASVTKSEYFFVGFGLTQGLHFGESGGIDNIVVSNTIDIQPPSRPFYTQSWFYIGIFAVVVAALLVGALLMRRKSR